jgi:glycosyltransferase involved in cell wall biosynthesis
MQIGGKLLSVIVPVYNEEPTVGDVINRLKTVLEQTGCRYEILVVDDCSRDKSRQIAKIAGAKVYCLQQHVGKGYALRAGFLKAKGDLIATIDSDGSHLPEEFPLLLSAIKEDQADLVIGSRFLKIGRASCRERVFRAV